MRCSYTKQQVRTAGRSVLNGLMLLALLFVLAGCGGDDTPSVEVPPDSDLPDNQLRLVCDDRCAERAQCGTADDGTPFVFLKRDSADVSNHDLAHQAGTVATVMETQGNQVVELANDNQFTVTFFQLLLDDQVTQAWISEWCVSR